MAASGRWTAGVSATEILKGVSSDESADVRLLNKGAAAVFLGGSGVTTATGYELAAGASLTVTLDAGENLFGVSAAGGEVVHWLRTS